MRRKVEIKSMDDSTATVAGYGVVFGGQDMYGEAFEQDTDFMLDLVPKKLVMFNHGIPVSKKQEDKEVSFAVKNAIGFVENTHIKMDDEGLFIEAVLDRSKEYVEQVLRLIEKGVIGWSSGSVPHLIAREGKSIKRWPIVEFSLTHEPAEPRTLGVEQLKTLFHAAGLDVPEGLLEGAEPKQPDTNSSELQIKATAAAIAAIYERGIHND